MTVKPLCTLTPRYHKLSAYHNTWTRSLDNVRLTDSSQQAMTSTLDLLNIFQEDVPPRVPFLNISEHFQKMNFKKNEFRKYF